MWCINREGLWYLIIQIINEIKKYIIKISNGLYATKCHIKQIISLHPVLLMFEKKNCWTGGEEGRFLYNLLRHVNYLLTVWLIWWWCNGECVIPSDQLLENCALNCEVKTRTSVDSIRHKLPLSYCVSKWCNEGCADTVRSVFSADKTKMSCKMKISSF